MSELVLFYSYSGNTKKISEKFGQENSFDICEIVDIKRQNKFAAYTAGCFNAMKGGSRPVRELNVKFEDYDTVNIFAPIWAGHPAPSLNGALKLIPKNKKIKLFMVSASGGSNKNGITKRIRNLGLEIVGYEDIKS